MIVKVYNSNAWCKDVKTFNNQLESQGLVRSRRHTQTVQKGQLVIVFDIRGNKCFYGMYKWDEEFSI